MKQTTLPTLLLITALSYSTSILAEQKVDSAFYIGVGGFSGSGEHKSTINSHSTTYDIDSSGNDFKIGYIAQNNSRFEISFTSIDIEFDNGTSDELSGIDFDVGFAFGTNKIMPFVSAGLGFYTYEDTAYLFADNEDLKGISFNISGGLFFDVAKIIEIETSMKLKNIAWQDIKYTNGDTLESTTSMINLYLGAKVKF